MDDALLLEYPTIDKLAEHINQAFQPAKHIIAKRDLSAKEIWRKSLSRELKCVYFGDVTLAKKYLTQPVDNYRDPEGRTALYIAVANEKTEMIAWLLTQNADPHLTISTGITVMDIVEVLDNEILTKQFDNINPQQSDNRWRNEIK